MTEVIKILTPKKPGPENFNREPRRKAEFFKPVNTLQSKVGYGGMDEKKLLKAQSTATQVALSALMRQVDRAKSSTDTGDNDAILAIMLETTNQIKVGGFMSGYPLITTMSDKLIGFLEVIEELNKDAVDIVEAFHTTMQAILKYRLTGSGKREAELVSALDSACWRYFENYPGQHL